MFVSKHECTSEDALGITPKELEHELDGHYHRNDYSEVHRQATAQL